MNQEDIIRMMQGQMQGDGNNAQQESPITRNPTDKELDTFIEKCQTQKNMSELELAQEIAFKLERCVHSPAEAVVLPLVLQRLQTKGG